MRTVLDVCKNIITEMRQMNKNVRFEHVLRESNKTADEAANKAVDEQVHFEEPAA